MTRYNAILAYCETPKKPSEITEDLKLFRAMTSDYCAILINLGLMRRIGKKGVHTSTYEAKAKEFTIEHFEMVYGGMTRKPQKLITPVEYVAKNPLYNLHVDFMQKRGYAGLAMV